MKLVEFTYKKADGTVSERAVIELLAPQQHFEGIDVTNMPEDEFAAFVQEYRELKNAQHAAVLELFAQHDLKHNYRRFVPNQMTDITTETI